MPCSKHLFAIALTLSGGVARAQSTNPVCARALQNVVAWDYLSHTRWSVSDLDRLCRGGAGIEPASCFHRVMHGDVPRGGGRWPAVDALALCAASADAVATVRCFETQLAEGLAVPAGIAACRAAPVVPGVRPDAGAPDAGAPAAPPAGPWVRETQTVVRDGVAEQWRLQWRTAPTIVCNEVPAACPCAGLTVAEAGQLELVRLRDGAPLERTALTSLGRFDEGPGRFVLRRWEAPAGTEGTLSAGALAALPSLRAMTVRDYDRDGRAQEFMLQVGAGPCGHTQNVVVGIAGAGTRLRVFSTAAHPERPLRFDAPASWTELAAHGVVDAVMVECGDHGADEAEVLHVEAAAGVLRATRTRYACTDDGARGARIAAEDW
jgi:hypothetical protein